MKPKVITTPISNAHEYFERFNKREHRIGKERQAAEKTRCFRDVFEEALSKIKSDVSDNSRYEYSIKR